MKLDLLSLLITGGLHFPAEAILPDRKDIFQPPVLAPLLLAFGVWVGYNMPQFGGNYGGAILAGAILGRGLPQGCWPAYLAVA